MNKSSNWIRDNLHRQDHPDGRRTRLFQETALGCRTFISPRRKGAIRWSDVREAGYHHEYLQAGPIGGHESRRDSSSRS